MTALLTPTPTAHLTRIQMDPWSIEVGRDLKDIQSLHRRVLSLTPDQLGSETRQAAGILYRLERLPHQHTLLIQSTAPLDLGALPVGYATALDERNLTPLLSWCSSGNALRYRIDAVATRAIATQERDEEGRRKRGRRIPVFGDDAITWWHHQAERAGLSIDSTALRTTTQPDAIGWKQHPTIPDKKIRIWNKITRFEGHATITAPDALRTALTTGIGRARAYGTGLLSIAPLTRP
ncbi:type I-E CRISPR-associated protein Cas6/Cse3/CasE [Streptomyces decoyicus]|uniref:type I-E CRISPR-associated protein Cas6/Cse3/CasE n=1 Tax=Streptomyces decoyicus TaxID=249567 RepID=UPI00386C17AA